MIKNIKQLIFGILLLVALASCSTEGDYNRDAGTNYRALWRVLDEGYCYFDQKLPKDSTWSDMYDKYLPLVQKAKNDDDLFDAMALLVNELKDGHVNLITPFDVSRYKGWYKNHPANIDYKVRNLYLGEDYRTASGIAYNKISYNGHSRDKIGLMVYPSFSSPIGAGNIAHVFLRFKDCKGIILDVRDNGGGNVAYAELLASHFAEEHTPVGYMRYKTGKGHNDFSERHELSIDTLKQSIRWLRPVVVLTNRGMYSAANDFALYMKAMPYATLLGDTTGGGGGLPRSSELPNGWAVRYSSSVTTDLDDKHIEFGVAPDKVILLKDEDVAAGKDTLIEEAIRLIKSQYIKQ